MAWRLFGAKPLSEPMRTYCQIDPWNKHQQSFYQNITTFIPKNECEKVFCKSTASLSPRLCLRDLTWCNSLSAHCVELHWQPPHLRRTVVSLLRNSTQLYLNRHWMSLTVNLPSKNKPHMVSKTKPLRFLVCVRLNNILIMDGSPTKFLSANNGYASCSRHVFYNTNYTTGGGVFPPTKLRYHGNYSGEEFAFVKHPTEHYHYTLLLPWASCQIWKTAGAHAPGMPGTFSPPSGASYPDMHHGTCVTHVPWCMPGSLTNDFPLESAVRENVPGIPGACATRNVTYLVRGPCTNPITVASCLAPWRLKSPASLLFTQAFIQSQIKENIKAPRHWIFYAGNSLVTGEFPAQRTSNAKNASIWWRHHAIIKVAEDIILSQSIISHKKIGPS